MIPKIEWTQAGDRIRAKFIGYELLLTRVHRDHDDECAYYGGGGWWNATVKARGRPRVQTEAGDENVEPLNVAKLEAVALALIEIRAEVDDELDKVTALNDEQADHRQSKKASQS